MPVQPQAARATLQVLPPSQRSAYAQRLCQPDVLTDFGVRTLSATHPQFAPEAYHRGAVWPFDSWLAWGGLRAAGRTWRLSAYAAACWYRSEWETLRSSTPSPREGHTLTVTTT